MQREHFKVDDIYGLAVEVLKAAGYPDKSAEATAYALLEADKRGIFSHGIAGGTGLEEAVKRASSSGTVDVRAVPKCLERKHPTIAVIDAKGAPGHVTSVMAVDLVKEIAREYGIGKVYVNNANHFGAAGVWSSLISQDKDLEGTVTCTTAAIAKVLGDDPDGLDYTKGAGKEIRIGSNPIAVSIPHEKGVVTLDMATTRLAASYCIKLWKAGELMKIHGYAADKDHKTTLDPRQVFLVEDKEFKMIGSIFPLGSEGAGYKGQSLGVTLEMDHALGGGPIERVSYNDTGGKRRVSHTFQAQAIDFLYDRDGALLRVAELMKDYEDIYFGPASRWPGDRSNKATEYVLKNGIPYSQGQIDTLRRAAAYVGCNFDEMVKSTVKRNFPEAIFQK
jgi:L-2-hydroxycarboxylate dehydrogenase (NAD+)